MIVANGKWWELHLDPSSGWLDGDQQGDFGCIIIGNAKPATALMTLREFDAGGMEVQWVSPDLAATKAALRKHPILPSGLKAPIIA